MDGGASVHRDGRSAGLLHIARRLAVWIEQLEGWRRHALSALAGAASILAFAPFFFSPILLLTFPVVFWLALGNEPADHHRTGAPSWRALALSAAASGWWFGFGFHLAGLYWIGSAFLVEADRFAWLMPFAVMLMPAGLALFHATAFATASLVGGSPLLRALGLATALSVTEWLRGTILTGFPWNTLGYALTHPLVLMQSASLFGIYGLSLLTALIALLPGVALGQPMAGTRMKRDAIIVLSAAAVPLALLFGYGAIALNQPTPPDLSGVTLRLVQPNIPQVDKFRADKRREIFMRTLALSQEGLSNNGTRLASSQHPAPVTHIFWPEAAMPFLALQSPEALELISRALPRGSQLIAGTLRLEENRSDPARPLQDVFNTTIVLDDQGNLDQLYDKVHLVPFGEYLPFQETLESFGLEHLTRQKGGFAAGSHPRKLMRVSGLPPLSMLICYEVIFPRMAEPADGRPGLLVNLTNDAWFGPTSGPYQHFHQARVRAVEQGLPLVRVANTGISALIDPYGRIRKSISLDVSGIIDAPLPAAIEPTLYSRTGEGVFAILLLFLALGFVLVLRTEHEHIM
jgi:apolipoprotein N-acyltransferase